jgi:signal transduction histidine kinase/ActR/RegA family two-component response regulator
MNEPSDTLFEIPVWGPALQKYGGVVKLSVTLYGADGQRVHGPCPVTPMAALFEKHGCESGQFSECVQACLTQTGDHRPPVIVSDESGLAVVGVSLLLDGHVVGAVVAGYATTVFCQSVGIARLARKTGTPFSELWAVARGVQPVPHRRLVEIGELLQVLAETLLRENRLRRHSEETAIELASIAAVKEGFLAVLSHELRTPLTPILGWASILRQHPDPKVVHAGEVIERNAVFQLRMVEDLLELTRTMRGKLALNLKVICLDDQLRSTLEAVADGALKKDIAVQLFIEAPEPLWISADGDRLQQILRNVLLNAIKFTPAGGAVTITLTKEGDEGVVRMRDTGEGIAPEFLPFVFEMFQQQEQGTRRTHPGLGIGLALVKQLTEAHGGTVSISSDGIGCGALATIRVPLAAVPEEVPQPRQPRGDELAFQGLRILVVEDMDDSREAMCAMLERFGASVVSASDGIEAIERLAADDVDLILCDLRMPRMDGFEFLRELDVLEGDARPPVIAVSGLAGSADHGATQAAGFTGHIDKPFDDGRLLAAVGVAMGVRRKQ